MATIGEISERPGEVIFEWRIKDFFSLAAEVDTRCRSPKFYFSGASWEILIYPNGESEYESGGWIGIYVIRKSTGVPLSLTYSLDLKTANGKTHPGIKNKETFVEKEDGYGKDKVISRKMLEEKKSELMPSDTLTVICTLKCDEFTAVGGSFLSRLQKLSDDFKEIYLKAKKSDFQFKVGGQNLHAHRLVLEARSSAFAAMLRYDTKEYLTGEACMEDMDAIALEAILLYMYSGETKRLTPGNAFRIYAAAHKYDIQDVKDICSQYIIQNLSVESVCDVVKFAQMHQDEEMDHRAREYFKENADKILESENWETFVKENHNTSIELLATVVKTFYRK